MKWALICAVLLLVANFADAMVLYKNAECTSGCDPITRACPTAQCTDIFDSCDELPGYVQVAEAMAADDKDCMDNGCTSEDCPVGFDRMSQEICVSTHCKTFAEKHKPCASLRTWGQCYCDDGLLQPGCLAQSSTTWYDLASDKNASLAPDLSLTCLEYGESGTASSTNEHKGGDPAPAGDDGSAGAAGGSGGPELHPSEDEGGLSGNHPRQHGRGGGGKSTLGGLREALSAYAAGYGSSRRDGGSSGSSFPSNYSPGGAAGLPSVPEDDEVFTLEDMELSSAYPSYDSKKKAEEAEKQALLQTSAALPIPGSTEEEKNENSDEETRISTPPRDAQTQSWPRRD
eukprot:gene19472-26131_t